MVFRRSPALFAFTLASAGLAGCVPELGAVDGNTFGDSVRVHDRFGSSRSPNAIVRIDVADDASGPPAGVGRLVKRTFFADTPPFVFNVSFSCGGSAPNGDATYTDPQSIWFNVFMGYYEIDVRRDVWHRPFGYDALGRPRIGDVIRLGKADWNYFSNYVYGVPLAAIRPHDELGPATGRHLGRVAVGRRQFDLVELDEVEVVSAYSNDDVGSALLEPDRVSTPIWRKAFGAPRPRPDFPTSFIGTRMHAKLYMSFREGRDASGEHVYRTTIFGATANHTFPDARESHAFLDAQLEAVRNVIIRSYPDLGFDGARP